jgi:hypothetical protein
MKVLEMIAVAGYPASDHENDLHRKPVGTKGPIRAAPRRKVVPGRTTTRVD